MSTQIQITTAKARMLAEAAVLAKTPKTMEELIAEYMRTLPNIAAGDVCSAVNKQSVKQMEVYVRAKQIAAAFNAHEGTHINLSVADWNFLNES